MAAAVAIVALSAGLLFQDTEKLRLQKPAAAPEHQSAQVASPVPSPKTAIGGDVQQRVAHKSTPLVIAPRVSERELQENLLVVQPERPVERLDNREQTIRDAKPEAQMVIAQVDESIMIADAGSQSPANVQTDEVDSEKKGIRNAGDLINFVVGKVDKRERKIIQFRTDEDENSSLVSLNLGIIKFNRKSDK
jgi:hypothetical protein